MSEHEIPRRDFVKSGLFLGAGANALCAAGAATARAAQPGAPARPSQIPKRAFGKTGRELPILGMGGSAMVGKWIASYGVDLISLDDRAAMVRHAYDRGVRYFDTARVYGESEQIMGRGLKGVREDCFVASKVHTTNPADVRRSIETSLEHLDTHYIDLMQVHSPAIEAVGFDGAMRIHGELIKLRDEGLIRHIGLTTHVAFETVYRMISTGGFEQVLLAYGYFRKGMDTLLSDRNIEWRQLCIAKAHELGMAIVAMKVLGATIMGHNAHNLLPDYAPAQLAKLPAAAIRWVLSDERVSMLNIGVSLPGDIDKNVATLSGDVAVTNADRRLLADFAGQAYSATAIKAMRTV